MALVKQLTFEGGSLTGANGFDSTSGSYNTVESTDPIVGSHSYRAGPNTGGANVSHGTIGISSLATFHLAMYFRVDAFQTGGDLWLVWVGTTFDRASVRINTNGTVSVYRTTALVATTASPITLGTVYRIEIKQTSTETSFWLATGDGASTLIGTAAGITGGATVVRAGVSGNSRLAYNVVIDEIHVDDAAIPTLPALPSAGPTPVNLEAETLLELTATGSLQQDHHLAASTLLELTTTAHVEAAHHLFAETLLELVATGTLNVSAAHNLAAETLLELVATGALQQEHQFAAETLLELTATGTLQADDVVNLAATTLLELVATAEVETAHHLRASTLLELVADAGIQQDHHLAAVTLLELVAHEGYIGPGTGLVVPGARFNPNDIREGDSFKVYIPYAGLEGLSALAHVQSRTISDSHAEQSLSLQPVIQPDPKLVPGMAGGGRPGLKPQRSDTARQAARAQREIDRIDRER